MRWLTLYARSRQAPASLTATLIGTATMGTLTRDGSDRPDAPGRPQAAPIRATHTAAATCTSDPLDTMDGGTSP